MGLDDYRKLSTDIEIKTSNLKAKANFKKQLTEKKKVASDNVSQLRHHRSEALKIGLQDEKLKFINEIESSYQQKKRAVQAKLAENKRQADVELSKVNVSDVRESINERLHEVRSLSDMRVDMDTIFNDVLGNGLIKVLNVRVKEARISDMAVPELIACIDQYGDILTRIRKYSPFKVLSLRPILNIVVFDPHKVGLADETTAWLWYLYLVGLLVVTYMFNFVLVYPLTFLLCYIGIANSLRYYRLYKLYIPYVQLKSSLDNLDSVVDQMLDKFIKQRKNVVKRESNVRYEALNAELEIIEQEYIQERMNAVNNFDTAKYTRLLSAKFDNDIVQLESQGVKFDEKTTLMDSELENIKQEIQSLMDRREKMKQAISNKYKMHDLSQQSKLLNTEFFYEFDGDKPVTANFRERSSIVFYRSGQGDSENLQVIDFSRRICAQLMISVLPNCLTITIVDQHYGGVNFAKFLQVISDNSMLKSESSIFRLRTSKEQIKAEVENMYEEFEKRRRIITSKFNNIQEYNEEQIKFNSATLPYLIHIFFSVDYALFTDDKLHQIIRNSYATGIIPIIYMDLDKFGSEIGQVKPDIAMGLVEVFDITELQNNIFTFEEGSSAKNIRQIVEKPLESIREYFRGLEN